MKVTFKDKKRATDKMEKKSSVHLQADMWDPKQDMQFELQYAMAI